MIEPKRPHPEAGEARFAFTAGSAPRPLNALTRLVLYGIILLVVVGVVDAVSNLPVITGCAFYGQCDILSATEAPSELGVSPVMTMDGD